MKRILCGWSTFALVALLAAGCSSDESNANNTVDGGGQDQAVVYPDLGVGDTVAPSCGAGVYPCGPYGTRTGEVIQDERFIGWSDNDSFCKVVPERVLNMAKTGYLSFHDWYRQRAECPTKKRRLLWVMASAGWCGPCIQEIGEIMAQIKGNAFDDRVDVVDILFEDDKGKPATEAYGRIWAAKVKMNFPLLIDPAFKMGRYFSKEAIPFNMLVDTETMKVFYSQTGSNLPAMGAQVQAFLKGL